jgi:NAD(P)-dependent dehydrogenase (short-subunit alcohol dehydrogenase family)
MGPLLGRQRHGPRLRGARGAASDARGRRRLSAADRVGRGPADAHPFRTYAVTKHAALAFAEWLSIAYGDQGIRVSVVCPQGVKTDMLRRAAEGGRLRASGASAGQGRDFLLDTALEPGKVADDVVGGIAAERFLILPHPEVAEFFRRKASDYDRWLSGMRRLRTKNV